MPHSPFVRRAYPGEDVYIPSSRGSGILSCQARALRFEPSVGPLSAPVHLCPCARHWHVAIPRRYIGAPELRLVVGESTSSCSHPFRDSCCVPYGNLQRSFVYYVYKLLSESVFICNTALFTEHCVTYTHRLNLRTGTYIRFWPWGVRQHPLSTLPKTPPVQVTRTSVPSPWTCPRNLD